MRNTEERLFKNLMRRERIMLRKRGFLSEYTKLFCIASLVVGLLAFSISPAVAATETYTTHFRLNRVGNSTATQTLNVPKGCLNQTLTAATVTMGPIFELSTATYINDSSTLGYLRINKVEHDLLRLTVSSLAGIPDVVGTPLPHEVGQTVAPCSTTEPWVTPQLVGCGGPGNYNGGSWAYSIPIGNTVIIPPFQTDGAVAPHVIGAGNLSLFKNNGGGDTTFPATLTAWADRSTNDSGSFSSDIRTDANGTITVEYVCQSPGLVCNHKYLDGGALLNLPVGQSFPHPVTVEISFTNGDVDQVVTVRDTFPNANWAYGGGLGGSAYFTNAPVQSSNTYTFTSNAPIPANATVVFHFTATMNVGSINPGQCLVNAVNMTGSVGGESNCSAQVCLAEQHKVPAMNVYGALILSLVMAGSAVWLLRRRRVS
jgi:hypothetical protein